MSQTVMLISQHVQYQGDKRWYIQPPSAWCCISPSSVSSSFGRTNTIRSCNLLVWPCQNSIREGFTMYPPLQKKNISMMMMIKETKNCLNKNSNLNFEINKQRLHTSNLASVHPCPYTFLQALHSFLSGTLRGTQKNWSIKQVFERSAECWNRLCPCYFCIILIPF